MSSELTRILTSGMIQVDSSFKSAQLFCACPMNYNHAIYKGPEEKM